MSPEAKDIDFDAVSSAALDIVARAKAQNTLKDLTKRTVRDQVESQLLLPAGSLQPHKAFLAKVVEEAVKTPVAKPQESTASSSKTREPQDKKRALSMETSAASAEPEPDQPEGATSSKKGGNVPMREVNSNVEDAIQNDVKSESEMSSLIDEPPPKKRKKAFKSESDKTAAGKKRKTQPAKADTAKPKGSGSEDELRERNSSKRKKVESGGKDDETIKKLKGFVVACGVRKLWSKEFKDCPDKRSQIAHLKGILNDLGMPSRASMAQAKKIKERRELEADAEAVQDFHDKIVTGSRRSSNKLSAKEAESSDSEEIAVPKRVKKSIADFVGSESD